VFCVAVLSLNAKLPAAVFCIPVVFACIELFPDAVLSLPVVFAINAFSPNAELFAPVVLTKSDC
jgi:hypothetical protein